MNKDNRSTGFKRHLVEWTVIGSIAALLYITGLHTEVLGTLQRAMLWTGFFDADPSKVETTRGPRLTQANYNFRMQNAKGQIISLGDFKGDVIFINIWASWCPPCVAEMPTIQTLRNNIGNHEDIHFLLLSLDREREKAVVFMKSNEFNLPYYFPVSGIPSKLSSPYLPTTYVISKEGQIVYRKEGIADYSSPHFTQWLREQADK